MTIFKSLILALSLYSKIPMPRVEWTKENMKYSLCFFPLVGVIIGCALMLWAKLSTILNFNPILFAAVASYIPVLLTGGIHMDGFCDTVDGLSSHQPMEKKLQILSDPNTGAFAIIKTCAYFLLYFAVLTQLDSTSIILVAFGYILSRILSALAMIHFKSAKTGGLLYEFQSSSARKIATAVLLVMLIILAVISIKINLILAIAALVTAFLVFAYYRYMAYKEFGGVTGDLAGYFLQLCELAMCFAIVFAQEIIKLWY